MLKAADVRRYQGAFLWAIAIATIASSWIVVFTRAIPDRSGDRGVFASMAERIVAGDTLYVDVWDNKEPFFYETLALGRLVSPYMDVVIELAWLAAAAASLWSLARALGVSRRLALVTGFGLTPIVLTGALYLAGFSHLPSTALFLVTCALLVRRRFLLAGMVGVLIVFFKIVMLPLVAAAALAMLMTQGGRHALRRLALGGGLSLVAALAFLATRGELVGYIDLLVSNVSYSQASATAQVMAPYPVPLWSHLEPVFGVSAVVVLAATAGVLAWGKASVSVDPASKGVWRMAAWSLVAAVAVLAVTGLWAHHAQTLYGPAVLALVLVAAAPATRRRTLLSVGVLLACLAVVLSGGFSLRAAVDSALSAPGRLTALSRLSEPTENLLSLAKTGSYQRLGKNTDDTHAQGLRNFTLGCYQFVQYTYDLPETLDYIPTCLPDIDYILVDKGFVQEADAPAWNRFVAESEAVLAREFDCEVRPWGRLCVNRSNGASGT